MSGRFSLVVFAALMLAACGQTPQQATASKPAASSEKLDPFVVSIDAQRWGVIIDRALVGANEAAYVDDKVLDNQLFNADAALKSAAARLIELRNQVCAKGLVGAAACQLKELPAWTREPPSGATPVEEIDRRSQWLSTAMEPFTQAGCEAGKKAANDELFCSVE